MPESLWQAVQHESETQRSERPGQRTPHPPEARTTKRTSGRPDERTNLPTPVPLPERPAERPTVRRPYDFYRDQILWMKEVQLAVEKRYGQRIAANAMVQLALDLLKKDYQRYGDRSKLIRELVLPGK